MSGGVTGAARAGLHVVALSLGFGGIQVLRGIDATFQPGQVTGLIGPNGAGKTSFFNCLTGLYRPNAGSISLGATSLDGMAPTRRARHGLARSFQHVALCPDLSALQNVMFGLTLSGRSGWVGALLGLPAARAETTGMEARARAALTQLGIGGVADLRPAELPPGTLRLVEIARAIVAAPHVLLLDEPAAGLNAAETQELTRTLRRLVAPELVIVVVEHDMDLIMEICDRIYVLNFGQVVACGTPDEVRRDPEVVRIYLGADED